MLGEVAVGLALVVVTTIVQAAFMIAGNWRMLASLQGANGVILFGWTTALIFYVIQFVYVRTGAAD